MLTVVTNVFSIGFVQSCTVSFRVDSRTPGTQGVTAGSAVDGVVTLDFRADEVACPLSSGVADVLSGPGVMVSVNAIA